MEPEDKLNTNLTEEIPEWKLRLAYFYTQHKIALKRGGWFMLFFINLIIIMVLGITFVNYQTGQLKEKRLLSQLPNNLVNRQAIEKNKPLNLISGQVQMVKSIEDDKVNLLVKITNPNKQWAVKSLTYSFVIDGQLTPSRSTFVLPASDKYLTEFNLKQPQKVQLKITDIQWQKIKDYSLLSYKDQIKTVQSKFIPSQNSKLFSGSSLITIYNDTPYGFWEVGLTVVLYDQQLRPLAVDYIIINKLRAQEKREVRLNWQEKIKTRVYQTKVYPEVNLLDRQTVMKLDAPPGQPPGLEK